MQPYLQVDQIEKRFGEHLVLDQLSFSIREGQCTGLLGANGAGKTTTLKILSGLLNASKGVIRMRGEDVDPRSISFRKKIGYLPQYPQFHEWMTGQEFLEYVAKLYDYPSSNRKSRIEEVLEIVELTSAKKKRIKGYSGGMKQRLGIAQAILHQPEFLILDEPVSALDPEGRYQVVQLIQQLKRNSTILLSTHILHDADSICDDVVIVHGGRKMIESSVDQLKMNHIEPIFRIHLLPSSNETLNQLRIIPWIESVEQKGEDIIVQVKDKEVAMAQLPALLLEAGCLFDSYQIIEPTLEDIFLKLVKQS